MGYEQNTIRKLYKKLLSFYPPEFKERFGESIEQTFKDLCNEQKQREQLQFLLVPWLFVETALGIIREYLILITQGDTMKTIIKDFRLAAMIGFLLVLPLAVLETLNNTISKQNALGLLLLFGILWLLPVAFIVILMPMLRTVRAGKSVFANPIMLLLRGVFLTLIATIWGWGFMDQLPCFLGVPNCD